MTASSKGVYITLICLIYEAEAPLPQAWDTLARRCGCTLPAFKKAVEALQDDGKIEINGAGIWSDKCEKHITQRRERQGSAKAAAKTRWEKTKENQGMADANALNPQCQPEPEPKKRDTSVSPKKRACALPPDWVPSDKNIDHALSKQMTQQEIDHEADRFRDYHLAKGTTFKDWDAGWRTWVGNAIKYRNGRMVGGQGSAGRGSGGGLAGAVARRRLGGEV